MQTIRIVISGGKAQSIEISEAKKPLSVSDVANMLRSMPKEMLAEALSSCNERQVVGYAT